MALSQAIIDKILLVDELSDQQLADFCELANTSYRAGNSIISDQDYDFVYLAALKKRTPNHPLLKTVEPEGESFSTDKVLLPEIMLSTDKAYSQEEVVKWLERIKKSSAEIDLGIQNIEIKATPKLDGFAGYDDGSHLYTRGDGKKGSDITRVFERGLQVYKDAKRGQGAGEIVVKKSYFEAYLSKDFEYPRNFQASLIKEKELDMMAKKAIADKAALFAPFNQLPNWIGSMSELESQFERIVQEMLSSVDFDVDGVVFEVTNNALKTQMGANRKFHRWQIAFKENKDKAQVKVLSVTPQVGRTGKITPVAELEPTLLSGATIMRATGHHYGLVREQGLGMGSVIELTRSGLVIPKINKVLKSVETDIPKNCPSCGKKLQWESDFLMCVNHDLCPAQVIGKMAYFFKILANNDGFGIVTIEKLYEHGIRKISEIYALNVEDLVAMSFGEKTSENLVTECRRSTIEQIEDWRFLAAFGVVRLGTGNCENLLKSCSLDAVFDLDLEKIANIEGFAELTAQAIVTGLQVIKTEFELLSHYNFNLEPTLLQEELAGLGHHFTGKKIIFTGKMESSRDEMKKYAKSIGMQVQSSINAKTDYLVIGEKVGQKKIEGAKKFDIKILSEIDYLAMINKNN
ncbi:DNA ligase [Bathymodiolus heckerae thiotrophic gill symbiont]|uniref:helix-hairpin-helix domain-containing protein n=1 Tax=Bathymodiolus heckerae thiotrophic gill symbiont TaxID=1052212 RepID=UPI0010B8B358|nr:helix-hairpin-helix domain-containing protein [Bathymodiolus heckerae thiotrophic gill symbiont]SMN13313.1 DNA ligase [Bathymodiolus heckerae thiotrophic gill symbiont]